MNNVPGQIDFEQYLDKMNKQYAKTCRHYCENVCYMNNMVAQHYEGLKIQCPCEHYEIRKGCYENEVSCVGKHDRSRCFKPSMCYRYCFNPDVTTKGLEDKYQPVGKKMSKKIRI